MATTDLRDFLLTLLGNFNPSLDISEGSPADRQVVTPLLDRVGPDPFSTDVRSFILEHLRREYPDIDTTSAGGQYRALLLGPIEALLTPLRAEIAQMRASRSMADPARLTRAEMDALLANLLGGRQEGARARLNVRVYFSERRAVAVTAGVNARTGSGLVFYATSSLYVASDTLGQFVENGRYYLDIETEAAEEGPEYNIEPGEIIEINGIPGAVSVTNKTGVTQAGELAESNVGALARIRSGTGERSPNTEGGISGLIYDTYPAVRDVRVVGYGDPEMKRDILRGTVTLGDGALGYGAIVDTVADAYGAAVDLTASDSFGPACSSLTLPIQGTAYFKTYRVLSVSSDFADAEAGQSLQIRSSDRVIRERISAAEVHIDDFELVAKGATGFTLQHQLAGGPQLLYALKFQDAARSWTTSGVTVGDWLRVPGGWALSGQPTGPHLVAGPGNTSVSYFQVQEVDVDGIRVSAYLPNEFSHKGDTYRVNMEDVVGTFLVGDTVTGANSGTTGTVLEVGSDYLLLIDVTLAGYDDEEAIASSGASAVVVDSVVDLAVVAGSVVSLHSTRSASFAHAPAAQVGDWITLCKTDGTGSYDAEEFEISAAPSHGGSVTVTGSPTACATHGVKWAIRRGAANGGVASRSLFLLGGTSSVQWAVLRYRADIAALADPEGYDWFTSVESGVTAQVRGAVTLASIAGSVALTISDVPMGITLPQRLGQSLEVLASDQVHIGGCTDVYMHQLTCPTEQLDLLIEPNDPLAEGTDLVCAGGTNVVSAASLSGSSLDNNCVLVVEEGEAAGSYRVLLAAAGYVFLDSEIASAFSGVRYYATRDLTMSFTTPRREVLDSSATLETVHQSAVVTDASVDFVDIGVVAGDVLEVTSGVDDGAYVVAAVEGNHTVRLTAALTTTATGVYYKIYRRKAGPIRPFRRITDVELLSAEGTTTGIKVPPRDPLAARSLGIRGSGGERTFTRSTFRVYGYYFDMFGIEDTSEGMVSSDLRHRVHAGDVCIIRSGANAGTYLVYYVDGNRIWLMGHLPLADSFPLPEIELPFDSGSGTFAVGNTVRDNGVAFGTITSITYATGTTGTMRVLMSLGVGAPDDNSPISTPSSAATCSVNGVVADLEVTLGPPAAGVARVYMEQPTVLELRSRGAQSADTALFETADLRQYVADPYTHYTYCDATDVSTGCYLLDNGRVLSLTSVVGTFVVGDTLEIVSSGSDLGTIVYVSDAGTEIWIEYTGPGTLSAVSVRSVQTPATTATVASFSTKDDMLVLDRDFTTIGVESGDLVEVVGHPLTGSADLAAGANLSGVSFTFDVGDGATQTVLFSGTNPIPVDQVSPRGIKQQINAALTGVTATVVASGASRYISLHAEAPIVVGGSGVANGLLGFTEGQTSESDAYGKYLRVTSLYGQRGLLLEGMFGAAAGLTYEADVKLRIRRPGVQRFAPADFLQSAGLYYVDVKVRSLQTGDAFNLANDEPLTVRSHRSYGYRLVSLNDALTYSTIEDTDIEFSALLLDADQEDALENLTTLGGKTVRVTYEVGDSALAAQSLLVLPTRRVVNNNPATKTMRPAFAGIDITYSGGSAPAVVLDDVTTELNDTPSGTSFEMAKVYGALARRGATRIDGPLEILAVRHNDDRTVDVVWSDDELNIGRTTKLAADTPRITVRRR